MSLTLRCLSCTHSPPYLLYTFETLVVKQYFLMPALTVSILLPYFSSTGFIFIFVTYSLRVGTDSLLRCL